MSNPNNNHQSTLEKLKQAKSGKIRAISQSEEEESQRIESLQQWVQYDEAIEKGKEEENERKRKVNGGMTLDDMLGKASSQGADSSSTVEEPQKKKRKTEVQQNNDTMTDEDDSGVQMQQPKLRDVQKIAPIPSKEDYPLLQHHTSNSNARSSSPAPSTTEKPFYPECHDDTLNVFWIDVFEDSNNERNRGKIFLFGKRYDNATDSFKSVCVIVENIYHDLHLLPNESVANDDDAETRMIQEITDGIASHIPEKKFRIVNKSYCFELDGVPIGESKYLNLRYSAKYNAIKIHRDKSNPVFKAVFGSETSSTERFLIEKHVQGPSWLTLKNVQKPTGGFSISFCDEEYVVDYKDVSTYISQKKAPSNPPFSLVSINTQTVMKDNKNLIVAISGVLHKQISIDGPTREMSPQDFTTFTCIYNPFMPGAMSKTVQKSHSTVHYCSTEKDLLNHFGTFIRENDPDVIVGHNFLAFHLDIILQRCRAQSVPSKNWSAYGRLKRSTMPKLQVGAGGTGNATFQEKQIVCGRLICDTYLAAVEYLREKSNALVHLAKSQLDKTAFFIDNSEGLVRPYLTTDETMLHLVLNVEYQAYLSMLLMFKMTLLPLTRELSIIAGNLWSKTLTGSRAERIEYLLMHQFAAKSYILPDKRSAGSFTSGRRKAKYGGGLVIEPKAGLYDKYVLLLDFNSLYPSLILQHNICFTTIQRPREQPLYVEPNNKKRNVKKSSNTKKSSGKSTATQSSSADNTQKSDVSSQNADQHEEKKDPFLAEVPLNKSHDSSVLPNILKGLLERRRVVKGYLKNEKDPYKRWLFDIRQKALKLTANSCYGCLGFAFSRFYCEPMAELITRKGRELLQSTRDEIQDNLGHQVVYGDTDSVMVLTPFIDFLQAKKLGETIKSHLNKGNRYLEIDIDGLFRRILLLRKKKYVAELHTPDKSPQGYSVSKEIKGVEIVRRDWSELSRNTSRFCVDEILSGKTSEEVVESIHFHLREVAKGVRNNEIPLEDFILYKGMNKMPSEYPDAAKQAHVQVAQEMINRGKSVRPGMRIAYLICSQSRKDGSDAIADRAYAVDEFESRKDLSLDVEYYLGVQVYPPVTRLCQFIEGTDRSMLSECLGLDTKKYGITSYTGLVDEEDYTMINDLLDEEDPKKYKSCQIQQFVCSSCKKTIKLDLFEKILDSAQNKMDRDAKGDYSQEIDVKIFACNHCSTPFSSARLFNFMQDNVRQQLQKYYMCPMVETETSDENNQNRANIISLTRQKAFISGRLSTVRQEFSSLDMQLHLRYYLSLVDWRTATTRAENLTKGKELSADVKLMRDALKNDPEIYMLDRIKDKLNAYLQKNGRNVVNLSQLF
eukprot:CAMPEP_0117450840 /NCGR_PEP_ID=MMETSP0759-20121206/8682_1 /TAXON_ID=63605 /ORGANISM="Percolomonas cosmopolitus, Strain WS" /LENGTH=1344 /DNA_ID=CAMNT_0005243387 /DNA_START=303 /DNA_END=4334 /DNA_ORIENTATION=+